MKILVTGCMGFIGSNLVPQLLNAGHEVVGFDNLINPSIRPTDRMKAAAGENWKNFRFFKGDIRKIDDLTNVFSAHAGIDAVVHLAALGSVPRSFQFPIETTMVNVVGFANLLRVMVGRNIQRLVYASSSSVYGDSLSTVKTEGAEGRPRSPYGLSKKANEDFAHVWGAPAGLSMAGLRFFNVYGPGQQPGSPYSAVIPRFITSEKPVLYGDGSAVRDFTYVDDVARAIAAALDYTEKMRGNLIANIGTGRATMVRELLGMLGRTAEKKPERTGDIRVSIADTRTAETVFGFKAEVGIVEGLARTKDFYDRELQHGRSGIQEGADAAGRPAVGEGSKRQSGGPQTDIG